MHNNHQSARKLEKVAESFTRLAEAYVRHAIEKASTRETENMASSKTANPEHSARYMNTAPEAPVPDFSVQNTY